MVFLGYWYMFAIVFGPGEFDIKLEFYRRYEFEILCTRDLEDEAARTGYFMVCLPEGADI